MSLTITPAQEALRQAMIAVAKRFQAAYEDHRLTRPKAWEDGPVMGTLVQPAHLMEGVSNPGMVPERRYEVLYSYNYGVVCQKLCTSNGSAWWLAACVRDDTRWEPAEGIPE